MSNIKFTQDFIDEAIERSEKIKEGSGKRLEQPGIYVLKIETVELTKSKEGKEMIVIKHRLDEEHETIDSFFSMSSESNVRMIVEYVWNGFGKKLKPAPNESTPLGEWIYGQVKGMSGKKVKAAVRIHESLFTKENGETIITHRPKIWYVGKENEPLEMDMLKGVVSLTEREKAQLANNTNINAKLQEPTVKDPWD